jgi:hypothetical protein
VGSGEAVRFLGIVFRLGNACSWFLYIIKNTTKATNEEAIKITNSSLRDFLLSKANSFRVMSMLNARKRGLGKLATFCRTAQKIVTTHQNPTGYGC